MDREVDHSPRFVIALILIAMAVCICFAAYIAYMAAIGISVSDSQREIYLVYPPLLSSVMLAFITFIYCIYHEFEGSYVSGFASVMMSSLIGFLLGLYIFVPVTIISYFLSCLMFPMFMT